MRRPMAWMRRNRWAGWLLSLPIWWFGVVYLLDRDPPFAVLSVKPAAARTGEVVLLDAGVRRDVLRRCNATFSRALYRSDGYRIDLEGDQYASAQMIEELERRTPGRLLVAVQLPPDMPVGRAAMVTTLRYRCNPVHVIWPIDVRTELPFEVIE